MQAQTQSIPLAGLVVENAAAVSTEMPASAQHTASEVKRIFETQQAAFMQQPYPSYAERKKMLVKLADCVRANIGAIQEAASVDFGLRSAEETLLTEVMGTLKSITYAKRRLKYWMREKRRSVDISFKPATAKLVPQPVGVVGIIAPWNYPFGLVIKPLISAIAAGNRVMIKPSELTPNVSALIRRMLGEIYQESQVAVVEGDGSVAQQFTELPFDHLIFTGGTAIGRKVMSAAASNLTPLTLELGGKSPVIIDSQIEMQRVVKSIATGKLLNGGQTCTAPDYVLVPKNRMEEFTAAFTATVQRMYPNPLDNGDYTSVINDRHYQRLQSYLDDAAQRGVELMPVFPDIEGDRTRCRFLPVLAINPEPNSLLMQEEIFGPILIVVPYLELSGAVEHIRQRPRPLALYLFTTDRKVEDFVLKRTIAGGVTINDTLLHYTQESLPFGGVGDSGFGAYHGDKGFETFTHLKPVFKQSRINGLDLLRAPYGKRTRWLLKNIIKTA